MIKRLFFTLAIVAGIMLALGCIGNSPKQVVSSSDSSVTIKLDHQYPQMYTPEMIENMDAIEKENSVTFLGCYDDTLGSFILWVNDNSDGNCYASIAIPPTIEQASCDDAWQIYLRVCSTIGNCEQLI
jgi:hypothetical protein